MELVLRPLVPVAALRGELVLVQLRSVARQQHLEDEQVRRERLAGAQIEARTAQHHLNNSLARVLGSLDLVLDGAGLDPQTQSLLQGPRPASGTRPGRSSNSAN